MKRSTNILRQQPRRALALTDIIMATLTPCGIEPSQSHVESFAKQLMERQIHSSKDRPALQVWDGVDILRFIKEAQDVGAVDEALWCTFLAAHFGRLSVGSPAP